MRLPIEDDWKPRLGNKDLEYEYEEYVRLLVKHMHEANEVADQQSKLSHYTAKRYDCQAKLEVS